MKADNAERFERLLAALEQDLIAATDAEVLEAAGDLGMNPAMKGSAAFFGVIIDLRGLFRREDASQSAQPGSTRRRLKDDPPP
jgi:hypothetical protein